jgi:hypothetical protein
MRFAILLLSAVAAHAQTEPPAQAQSAATQTPLPMDAEPSYKGSLCCTSAEARVARVPANRRQLSGIHISLSRRVLRRVRMLSRSLCSPASGATRWSEHFEVSVRGP